MDGRSIGLIMIGGGVLLVLVGLLVYAGGFSWFGRLPGDIRYEGESTRVFVPLTSMVLLSVLLTILLNLLRRFL